MNDSAKIALARFHEEKRKAILEGTYIKPERLNPLEKALSKPTSYSLAVRAACWDCVGGDGTPNWQNEVSLCLIKKCGLYHLRPYRDKGKA